MANNYAFNAPGKCSMVTVSKSILDMIDIYDLWGTEGEIRQNSGYLFSIIDIEYAIRNMRFSKNIEGDPDWDESWAFTEIDVYSMLQEAKSKGFDFLVVTI